jgi:DnaJ-domain-containing protein 1
MSSYAYRPRFGFDIRINPDKPRPKVVGKRCAKPGCAATADVYVPKSRQDMNDRQWLCREHLREHNQRWNYFAGMSDQEIEQFCLDAVTGHRPTWPLGKRAAPNRTDNPERSRSYWSYRVEDGFAVFEEAADATPPPRGTRLTKGQLDALAVLNLEETASLHDIKARYKELVKRFHPDANGGNRGTEERLRQVIRAYGHLRATGLV